MTVMDMLNQSAIIAVLGIGIVSSFFLILIAAITIMGKILKSSDSSANAAEIKPNLNTHASADNNTGDQVIAAISTAVAEYRKSH